MGMWALEKDRGKYELPFPKCLLLSHFFPHNTIFWRQWQPPAEYWNMQHYIFPGAGLDLIFSFSDKKLDHLCLLRPRDPRSWELWVQLFRPMSCMWTPGMGTACSASPACQAAMLVRNIAAFCSYSSLDEDMSYSYTQMGGKSFMGGD